MSYDQGREIEKICRELRKVEAEESSPGGVFNLPWDNEDDNDPDFDPYAAPWNGDPSEWEMD